MILTNFDLDRDKRNYLGNLGVGQPLRRGEVFEQP